VSESKSLSSLSEAAVNVKAARMQRQRGMQNFEKRSSRLVAALQRIEQAEEALREARLEASESLCRGILYRIDRILVKTDGMRKAITRKRNNLEKKIG
jgi:hypothetical protein